MKTAGEFISCETTLWGAFDHHHVPVTIVGIVQGFDTLIAPQ